MHHFVSYSRADGNQVALSLCDALEAGTPAIHPWLDQRSLRPGDDWDTQLVEAIRMCRSLLFLMTRDSVEDLSTCKREWTRALKYKKPLVPILVHADAEMPFRLEPRQHLDFTGNFEAAVSRLRDHLRWLDSPEGLLRATEERLANAQRDRLRAVEPAEIARVEAEIIELSAEIARRRRAVEDPAAAAREVAESIAQGLERERSPEPASRPAGRSRVVNRPPATVPAYFQDREIETRLIGEALEDEGVRLMMVIGRGGLGKTVLVCRALQGLESGRLPDGAGEITADGIVYLSAVSTRPLTLPNLYADLARLLPADTAKRLEDTYRTERLSVSDKMQALLAEFPSGRTVVLLDNFEDVVDPSTLTIKDADLEQALRALLSGPPHAVRVIVTSRVAPPALALVQPAAQRRIDLDQGLVSPHAENVLRAMDVDGKVQLRTARDELLSAAGAMVGGNPRALEHLFAILSADRDTSLEDILADAAGRMPENVQQVLVGESFSRLDPTAQQVMEAIAIYGRPVRAAAVDHLLQPYMAGLASAPVLARLVNMHLVRKEADRYGLHPVDQAYVLGRIPVGEPGDRETPDDRRFTRFALFHRGADYFAQVRVPPDAWRTIDDVAGHRAEFDLRIAAEEWDTAAGVLLEIDSALLLWGHYRLVAGMHELLRGKLGDPGLTRSHSASLGSAYAKLGLYQSSIECYTEALERARELADATGERDALAALGWCYVQIGDTRKAIEYCEASLQLCQAQEDRPGECAALGELGWYYGKLGQAEHAIALCRRALALAQELGDQVMAGFVLSNLAGVLIDAGELEEAIGRAGESVTVGEANANPTLGNWSNGFIARAQLAAGNLAAARAAAEAARRYDEPENNAYLLALTGVIAARQREMAAAREAFTAAIEQADTLLARSATNYDALDAKGLSLCGLALCEGDRHLASAAQTYRAARAINRDEGVVQRVLRLLDDLAAVDGGERLAAMRPSAAGLVKAASTAAEAPPIAADTGG